jgi:hypothetical protein
VKVRGNSRPLLGRQYESKNNKKFCGTCWRDGSCGECSGGKWWSVPEVCQNQFGIMLHVQQPVEIGGGTHALMAGVSQVGDTVPMDSLLNAPMQALLTEAKSTLGINEGEYTMFIAAQPDVPPSTPSVVMVAQANTSQQTATQREHIFGLCELTNIYDYNGHPQVEASPVIYANAYFNTHDAKINPDTAKITVLQQPRHGHLEPDSEGKWEFAKYFSNEGYVGYDTFIVQVEGNGYTIKLHYFVAITNDIGVTTNPNPVCKGPAWVISN